jgi:hypothetical protein
LKRRGMYVRQRRRNILVVCGYVSINRVRGSTLPVSHCGGILRVYCSLTVS